LFYGGSIEYYHYEAPVWAFTDNLFDNTTIIPDGDVTNRYNGYTAGMVRLTPTNTVGNVFLTVTNLTLQDGPLGRFYLSTSGVATNLVNKGSTNANTLGFYHFTTTTNQVKETNSVIDIGFHYVAVTNGLPIDTDGDGLSDYYEDVNGNGTNDNSSETSFVLWDTDGDGLSDGAEYSLGTNPNAGTNTFTLQITDDADVTLSSPVTGRVVGIRVDLKARTVLDGQTNNLSGLTYTWSVGGQAINTYYHDVDEVTNGTNHEHRVVPLDGSAVTGTNVSFFWTAETNLIPLQLSISKGLFSTNTSLNFTNVYLPEDPAATIYTWLSNTNDSESADPKRSPDGPSNVCKVVRSHNNWHYPFSTGFTDGLGGLMADNEYPIPFMTNTTGQWIDPDGGETYWGDWHAGSGRICLNGSAFLRWHQAFLAAHIAWRTNFNVHAIGTTFTDEIPLNPPDNYTNDNLGLPDYLKRTPPLLPTNIPPNRLFGGWTSAGVHGYVRLGEFRNLDELGRSFDFSWHADGHNTLRLIDRNDVMGDLRSPRASDDLFWKWHTRIDCIRADWIDGGGSDVALITSLVPAPSITTNGPLAEVIVAFDNRVSAGSTNAMMLFTPSGLSSNCYEQGTNYIVHVNTQQLKANALSVNGSLATNLWDWGGTTSRYRIFRFTGFQSPGTGTVTLVLTNKFVFTNTFVATNFIPPRTNYAILTNTTGFQGTNWVFTLTN
jgi:hypothetical protein